MRKISGIEEQPTLPVYGEEDLISFYEDQSRITSMGTALSEICNKEYVEYLNYCDSTIRGNFIYWNSNYLKYPAYRETEEMGKSGRYESWIRANHMRDIFFMKKETCDPLFDGYKII